MTQTKFTSGEWSQSHREDKNTSMYSTEVYDSRGHTICTLAWHTEPDCTRTDRPENASLIATAPDMYAMIKEVADMQKQYYGYGMQTHMSLKKMVGKMELILKKARGES